MYVVDASVWVSWFIRSDLYHGPSRGWLDWCGDRAEVIASPVLLLAELAGAVARRAGDPDAGKRAAGDVQALSNVRLAVIDAELGQLGAQTAADLRLAGADALYVALAAHLGVPLVTWDREQRDRGGPAARVVTPEEALAG